MTHSPAARPITRSARPAGQCPVVHWTTPQGQAMLGVEVTLGAPPATPPEPVEGGRLRSFAMTRGFGQAANDVHAGLEVMTRLSNEVGSFVLGPDLTRGTWKSLPTGLEPGERYLAPLEALLTLTPGAHDAAPVRARDVTLRPVADFSTRLEGSYDPGLGVTEFNDQPPFVNPSAPMQPTLDGQPLLPLLLGLVGAGLAHGLELHVALDAPQALGAEALTLAGRAEVVVGSPFDPWDMDAPEAWASALWLRAGANVTDAFDALGRVPRPLALKLKFVATGAGA